ncbi:MAG: hypothetical protein WCK98_03125 [bacterium]
MTTNLSNLTINFIRPGGNDTALIQGDPDNQTRTKINQKILKTYKNIEQVGFYTVNNQKNLASLTMAGEEFCGNAARALAFLILKGKEGNLNLRVSGSSKVLEARVLENGQVSCQMPIYKTFSCIKEIGENLYLVKLRGIKFLITKLSKASNPVELKSLAKSMLARNNLLTTCKASGVIFTNTLSGSEISIQPIVWVRKIQTLFLETACASGSSCIAMLLAKENGAKEVEITVEQPSKKILKVTVCKYNNGFQSCVICGPVEKINTKYV